MPAVCDLPERAWVVANDRSNHAAHAAAQTSDTGRAES